MFSFTCHVTYQFKFNLFYEKIKRMLFPLKIVIDYFPKCDRKFVISSSRKNYNITVSVEVNDCSSFVRYIISTILNF